MNTFPYKISQLILWLTLISCQSIPEQFEVVPEETYSLNSEWKFNTIYGQGYNYLNVKETPSDLIIDNADTDQVEVKGKWQTRKKATRGSVLHGKDYFFRNFKKGENTENYVRFRPKLTQSGYYEAFVKHPYANHTTVQCNINHAEGKTPKYVIQRSYCGEWISLGIYRFDKEQDNYVEITAITEGGVAADAVMFTPISEARYTEAKKLPDQVFLPSFDDTKWHHLKVPGHWGMLNAYSNYNGLGWYRKSFELPTNWSSQKDERIRIQFGAVYHVANVYLNGKHIGKHQGGLTPFELDITNEVKFGEKNVIAVEVNNNFIVGATWNWGGIIRDVTIKKDKDVRIAHQYIHAEPNLEKGTADVTLKVRLENSSNETRTIDVRSGIKEIANVSLAQKGIEVAPNSTKIMTLTAKLRAEDVKLWHFDAPHLYTLQTTISDNDINLDSKVDDFGIRKVELTPTQLILNGEPIRTGGFNRVSEHRYWGSSEPLEVLEKDVDLMKEAGANFMRIMHGTQNEKLISLCDKKGILLFEEVNVRNLTNPEFTAPDYPLIKSWIKEMVERDINHPSIIGWSIGNELAHHHDYAKMAMEYVRTELDEFRLLTCVSNSGQKEQYTPETDPNTYVDLIMHNMYRWQGQPQEILNTLRTKWPDKPIFISEYGFDPYPNTFLDGDKPIVSEWNQHFRGKNEFVIGTSMWTFNDYRSGYAGTTAEENRVWGLVNVWRQKRRLFERVQKENSPIKTLEIGTIDWSERTTSMHVVAKETSDYPSYTLKGYKVVYTFSDKNGATLFQEEVTLPTLKPGATWQGSIAWNAVNEPYQLNVRVVNPMGYPRAKRDLFFDFPEAPKIAQIVAGSGKARIYFDPVIGVKEYIAGYKTKGRAYRYTKPTISNFIDLDSLSKTSYQVVLIGVNGKGKSRASEEVSIQLSSKKLPPIVWKSFIADQKLVIGYSSELTDGNYTIAYGETNDHLKEAFTSNVRGIMTIDLKEKTTAPLYFKIQREANGENSLWSPVIKVKPSSTVKK